MVHTPSDRVQVRQLGDLQPPGACALCGNGTCPKGYVDLDIFYEWEGQVYLCWNCAEQVAQVIGCLLPEESDNLRDAANAIGEENKQLKERNDAVESELNAFRTVLDDAVASGRIKLPVNEESEAEPESTDESVNGSGDGESEPEESVNVERPHDPTLVEPSNKREFAV